MKKLMYIFLFTCGNIFSQSVEAEIVFWDLIDKKFYPEELSELGYLKKVDFKTLKYHLDMFEKNTTLLYYGNKIKKTDSIQFRYEEKEYLITELNKSKDFSWNLSNEKNLIQVDKKEILEFLKTDRNRELRIISKPIFIRNNTIVCLFSVHLCCGHIYGHATLCLYKKIDGKWKRWIHLTNIDY